MGTNSEQRNGLLYGVGAYSLWGLLPLYWHLLETAGAGEVLANRMVWSLPTAVVILAGLRRWSWIRPLLRQPKRLALIVAAAAVISANWGFYIWAIIAGKVVETSLGYFINPLVSIAFGVLFLRERLRPAQWIAVGLGTVAVAVMGIAYGQVPWLSLGLALSFATYGLVKKYIKLNGVEGFSAETATQFLPALGFLIYLAVSGQGTFTTQGLGHTLLFVFSGLATALPLIFFGAATMRLPLSTIGLLQYLAPVFIFVLGLLVFHEPMPAERWVGFAMVWAALALLSWDALHNAHRGRTRLRTAREAAPSGGQGHGEDSGRHTSDGRHGREGQHRPEEEQDSGRDRTSTAHGANGAETAPPGTATR
jgi:chloramphenicol-sensitive protein RarD